MYESIVTISLFYQLESFSNCCSHLETKLNVHSLLHHYNLHGTKSWLSMNDKREVTDLLQRTRWKSQLTRTRWNMFLRAFKCM
jgi:hypothetical protein